MTEVYAEFFFPGSFVSESSVRQIADRGSVGDWPQRAYACRTYELTVTEVDGERVTGKPRDYSPMTFRGEPFTLDKVKQFYPDSKILIANMEGNGWNRVVRTLHGQFFPMDAKDLCLPESPR